MDERTFATQATHEYDDDHQDDFLENVDNNLEEDKSSWILLNPESASSSSYNCDDECPELIDEDHSSDESTKTILTIDEGESVKNDADDNKDDESSDSDTTLEALGDDDFETKLYNYQYPIPEDPGLVPGFWVLYPKPPSYDYDGVDKFRDLVGAMKLQPIERMSEMLRSNKIDLQYYGVNPKIVRAFSEAAFQNTSVETLDLRDNWLTVDACYHLNHLLVNNNVLSSLNLSGCRIGSRGAKRLQEGIGAAPALQYLNISGCDLGDEGLTYISTGVYCSLSLQTLNLRDNKLGDGSGIQLQVMLTQSDSLTELNLSWNSLFSFEFWKKFTNGLNRNHTLTHLDIARNSLGKECTPLLAKYLSSSPHLQGICLQGNKFEAEEALQIAKALMKNTTLKMLHLGNNSIEDAGAYAIIKALTPQVSPHSQMHLLDLENIWASKDVIPLLEEIKKTRSSLKIKLGGILGNYELVEPDPRKIFLKRANFEAMKPKKKKQRKDFGQFVLSLEDKIISREVFQKSVKRYKLKLSKSLVTEIMDAFAIGVDAIDQSSLKAFYLKEYPDTYPAPEKPKKSKKTKKKPNKKGGDTGGKKKPMIKRKGQEPKH